MTVRSLGCVSSGHPRVTTIGDAYMAVAGLPDVRTDHVEAAAEMALEIRDGVPHI
jgi:adenylate cyclase